MQIHRQNNLVNTAYSIEKNDDKGMKPLKTKNKTAAVVVTYNRIEMLKKCIEALQKQTVACDILVINNDSSDGTDRYLSEETDVIHIRLEENTGGAGGFYEGMRQAVLRGYDYVWVMDDDCFPESTALEYLLKTHEQLQGEEGWLSSRCLWIDGQLCPMNIQRISPYKDVKDFRDAVITAQMASFVSLFIPSDVIRKSGLPIKEFFIWTDDWEFTRRISRVYPCYVVRDSIVIHAMKSKTVANIATDVEDRIPRYKYLYRNDVVLYCQEGLRGQCWLLMKNLWHTVQTLMHGRFHRIPVIWKGYNEGRSFHPMIRYPEQGEED